MRRREMKSGTIEDAARLSRQAVAALLTTKCFGRTHAHLPDCGSTNDELARWARSGQPPISRAVGQSPVIVAAAAAAASGCAEGTVVSADAQSSGRGRMGRAWHSPAGTNLYFSILLRPRGPAVDIPPVTLLAGAALARTVRRLGIDARVKWPNDLLIRPRDGQRADVDAPFRKVAGILTEGATEGDRIAHVVVGIGINVNGDSFPDALAERATSLRLVLGALTPRAALLAQILADFEEAYVDFQSRGAAAAVALWQQHALLGQRCRAQVERGDTIHGVTTGVGSSGELLVRDDCGVVHRVFSGEVTPID